MQVHVNFVLAVIDNAVGYYLGVAVAQFVVFFDNAVFVVLVVGCHELFLAEELDQAAFFVGFFHHPL